MSEVEVSDIKSNLASLLVLNRWLGFTDYWGGLNMVKS